MNKQQWKLWYRQMRVVRREHTKAMIDMMTYGTGVVYLDRDGATYHVPFNDWTRAGTLWYDGGSSGDDRHG